MKQERQPFILYVTGQSTSGKTTLYKSLKRRYQRDASVAVHDIDENGVPKVGRGHWRLYRVDELLALARGRFELGKSTIICGITLPHEVIGSECYEPRLNIHYLMLKLTQKEFDLRIRERLAKAKESNRLGQWKRANNQIAKVIFNQVVNQSNHLVLNSAKYSEREIFDYALEYISEVSGT